MAFRHIADDDELLCGLVKATLRQWGHTGGSVENDDDLTTLLPPKKPDPVILDCNMPGQSGIMVLRPFMLTALDSEADEAITRFERANDYIRKPADLDLIVFRVDELLAQRARHKCQ